MAQIKDTMGKIARTRNSVEELLLKIPGFKGYAEAQYRRESDKLHRDYLSRTLDQAKRQMTRLQDDMTDAGRLDGLDKIGEVLNRLDTAISRIKYADRGYSGFFATVKIDLPALEVIHQLDLALVTEVTAVEQAIKGLVKGLDNSALKDALLGVDTAIEQLNAKFKEREDAVTGVC